MTGGQTYREEHCVTMGKFTVIRRCLLCNDTIWTALSPFALIIVAQLRPNASSSCCTWW